MIVQLCVVSSLTTGKYPRQTKNGKCRLQSHPSEFSTCSFVYYNMLSEFIYLLSKARVMGLSTYIGLSMPSLCVYHTQVCHALTVCLRYFGHHENFTNDHCYMAEILPIRCKTLYNQSINQALTVRLHRSSHRSVNALIVCLRNIGLLMPSLCVYDIQVC